MYIKLDENLVSGQIKDINEPVVLPGQSRKEESSQANHHRSSLNVLKYALHQGSLKQILQEIEANPRPNKSRVGSLDSLDRSRTPSPIGKREESSLVVVAGSDTENVWFDYDMGFFSAILACYNNHWILKTRPDDWWNTIARTIAQNIDDNADGNRVRDFFVDHGDKKDIIVNLPGKLDEIKFDWLFDQFASGLRNNIKAPGYVDQMVAKFSTTSSNHLISNQVMLMSSLSKYFKFEGRTLCGIPGVEMQGDLQDWESLKERTKEMQTMLAPIMEDIGLKEWFVSTLTMLDKLLDTFQGKPDVEWWGHILSWDEIHSSGHRNHWSGWMIDFLRAPEKPTSPKHFQGGVMKVPLVLKDEVFGPPVKDTATLVAGIAGFKVAEGDKRPVVEAQHGWALLLPDGSPVIKRMRSKDLY